MRLVGAWLVCLLAWTVSTDAQLIILSGPPKPRPPSSASGSCTTDCPLFDWATQATYLGCIRTTTTLQDGLNMTGGGIGLAYNASDNSLFMGDIDATKVANYVIPTPVIAADSHDCAIATYNQAAFMDPTEGHRAADFYAGDSKNYGLFVYNGRLIGGSGIYYDAGNAQTKSHFARNVDLTISDYDGYSIPSGMAPDTAIKPRFFSGFMASIPTAWQSAFGGPVLTGLCCPPIVDNTSSGPSAAVFNPDDVGGGSTITMTPLVYYPANHRTLGCYDKTITDPPWSFTSVASCQNEVYGNGTKMGGMVFIKGTRTILYFGANGSAQSEPTYGTSRDLGCYGEPTTNLALQWTEVPGEPDVMYCYNGPSGAGDKGNISYPLYFQVWAYDANDLVKVKAGTTNPGTGNPWQAWEVEPYAHFALTLPFDVEAKFIGGVAYDSTNQLLYITQREAVVGAFSAAPAVLVYHLVP